MRSSRKLFLWRRIIFSSLFMVFYLVLVQDIMAKDVLPNVKENHKCFKCHGNKTYTFYNTVTERMVNKRMNPFYVIDTAAFYEGNHRLLSCTDCHDPGYESFPHDNELQMQELLKCTDCHDGDEVAEKYNFSIINTEFKNSVHAQAYSKDFSCWMCHNPHSYAITARKNTDISKVIVYDNEICLHCHSEVANLTPLSDHAKKNISTIHDWLPNQIQHFKSVRCLDCHVKVENNTMVDHQILSKEGAVKDCVACHSKNTRLLATLYKFQSKELRSKNGFLNAIILNDSYVISANSNYFLNTTSLVIFGLILLVIIIHAILRITLK